MIRKCQLIFFIWIWILPVFGQNGSLLFNHLGVKDGLSEAVNLYNVFKDSRGFIWISSGNGLNRFDGTSVTRYFPNSNDSCAVVGENIQSSFFEEDSSTLWFTTTEAINRYDWQQDCFKSFYINDGTDSLDGYQAFALDTAHNLWVLGSRLNHSYIFTFNTNTFSYKLVFELTKDGMRTIAVPEGSGNVRSIWTYWIDGIGVEKIEVDKHQNILLKEFLWDSTAQHPLNIRQIIAQGDSLIWVLSKNSLLKYNLLRAEGHFIAIDLGEALSLQLMNDSTLLVGFLENGMWEFNISSEVFTNYYMHSSEDGLSLLSNNVDHISLDRSGDVWIASRGFGLNYANPQKKKFNTFYPQAEHPEIKDFSPTSFLPENQDELCCATRSSGLFLIHRTNPTRQEIKRIPNLDPKSLLGAVYDVFKDRKGRYWLATFPGLSVFDATTGKLVVVSRESQIAVSGISLSNDKMLFCGRGLFEAQGNMERGFKLAWNHVVPDSVHYLPIWLDRKGRIWVSEYDGKFFILDSTDFHIIDTLSLSGYSTHKAESSDGRTIWINTSKNLYEIDSDSLIIREIHNEKTGLPTGGCNSMIMDLEDRLWLTSAEGILRLDPQKNDSIKAFNQEDGLPHLQYSAAAFRFDDGEIWLGSMQGITRFYPDSIRNIRIDAIPQITEILVNDHPPIEKLVCDISGSTNVPLIQKLTFDYKDNTLAFRVNALEYSSPLHNKVKYQMVGLDAEFIEASTGSLVRYPNMQYGTYRFVVYASNSDGGYNQKPRVLLIQIKTPYYKTWWFKLLMILFGGALLAYIVYLRFSKTLELQRVRLKLYENLHDDVGSRLTAIVLSAEDLERNQNIHNPKIESISKIAKSIVGNMRRLVWAIDPENDKMSNLIQKITHDKSLILDDTIAFSIQVDDHLKNVIVPGEIRYQIISICNEAFNNVIKYAKATSVIVTLSKENRNFHLTITDNGIGFDTSSTSKNNMSGSGYGLNNMKRRASRVKGKLDILSKPGEGTRIIADFPY